MLRLNYMDRNVGDKTIVSLIYDSKHFIDTHETFRTKFRFRKNDEAQITYWNVLKDTFV